MPGVSWFFWGSHLVGRQLQSCLLFYAQMLSVFIAVTLKGRFFFSLSIFYLLFWHSFWNVWIHCPVLLDQKQTKKQTKNQKKPYFEINLAKNRLKRNNTLKRWVRTWHDKKEFDKIRRMQTNTGVTYEQSCLDTNICYSRRTMPVLFFSFSSSESMKDNFCDHVGLQISALSRLSCSSKNEWMKHTIYTALTAKKSKVKLR